MAYVKMVNSVFLQRIQPFKLEVYFAVFASMVWGLSALKKKNKQTNTFVTVEMTAAYINVLHQP